MLETLHIAILVLAGGVILFADHEAFGYLTGKTPILDRARTMLLHRLVWVLLFGMIITGVLMAYPQWSDLWPEPLFRLKLAFVVLLFTNSFVINAFMSHAFATPFRELPRSFKVLLIVSGGASALGWLGAAGIGLYLFG
jgi:cytochrome b subunit of formate dehydrogenase